MRRAHVVHEVAVEHPVAAVGLAGVAFDREHGGHALDGGRTGGRQHDQVRPDGHDHRGGGDERRNHPGPRRCVRPLPPRAHRERGNGPAGQEDRERHAQGGRFVPFDQKRPGAVHEPADDHDHDARRGAESCQSTPPGGCPLQGPRHCAREEDGQRRQKRQDVTRLLADGQRVEGQRRRRPDRQPQHALVEDPAAPALSCRRRPQKHERGPRKQAAGDYGQVVPRRPRRVVAIRGVTLEILGKEEPLQIPGAVLDRHRGVPGRGHEQKERGGKRQVDPGRPGRQAVAPPVQCGEG